MRKWKCSVCGYVHTGDAPPEKCPVCGADRSKFVEITGEEPAPTAAPETTRSAKPAPEGASTSAPFNGLSQKIHQFHIHPISVHVPNGLLPVSVFFLFLSRLFSFQPLASASYFNMIFVLCVMPVVLFSGYSDWKSRFKGILTRTFKIKMACGATVTLTALMIVLWGAFGRPEASPWLFFLIHLIMLAAAAVAGLYGGKLVFKE